MSESEQDRAKSRICVGRISAPHGVRGEVKVESFCERPASLFDYGTLCDRSGRELPLKFVRRVAGSRFVARIEGISSRKLAGGYCGKKLYTDRARLPDLKDDEFYHVDLIGTKARRQDGDVLGCVVAVHDFGAGDLLEIRLPSGKAVLLPFTAEIVPELNLEDRVIIVVPPEGTL